MPSGVPSGVPSGPGRQERESALRAVSSATNHGAKETGANAGNRPRISGLASVVTGVVSGECLRHVNSH